MPQTVTSKNVKDGSRQTKQLSEDVTWGKKKSRHREKEKMGLPVEKVQMRGKWERKEPIW